MKVSELPLRKYLSNLIMICLSIAVPVLIAEMALRFLLPPDRYYIWPPHLKKVFKPHPDVMPGVSGDAVFLINSDGVRGDELTPVHRHRILAIGGSTTESLILDQSETWPYGVQKRLNENRPEGLVWVGNVGKSGKTSRHHVMAMKYLPLTEMKIDTVILMMGVNDFSIRLARDQDYDPNFFEKPEAEAQLKFETFTASDLIDNNDPFFKKTAIWQMGRRVKRSSLEKTPQSQVQDESGKIYLTWRKHRQNASEIRDRLPNLSSSLNEYAANINKIADIASERSIRLVWVTQPAMWRAGLPKEMEALLWLGGVGPFQEEIGKPYYSTQALQEGLTQYNDTLRQICKKRQLECIDLVPLLEKDTTVFYDDAHFNENGAQQVSKIVSEYLLARAPFTPSVANR